MHHQLQELHHNLLRFIIYLLFFGLICLVEAHNKQLHRPKYFVKNEYIYITLWCFEVEPRKVEETVLFMHTNIYGGHKDLHASSIISETARGRGLCSTLAYENLPFYGSNLATHTI